MAAIGHLPQGKGLLGALIEDPEPIRLRAIADDPRSSGFPARPPADGPASSASRSGSATRCSATSTWPRAPAAAFTAEDEELTKALAATAGVAIDNARLYDVARTRERVAARLGRDHPRPAATDPDDEIDALRQIAEHALEIARADLVAVVLPDRRRGGPARRRRGRDRADAEHRRVARAAGRLAVPVRCSPPGPPCAIDEPDEQPVTRPRRPPTGSTPGRCWSCRWSAPGRVHGVLVVARLRGRPAFTAEDLDMAGGFANQASVALELAEARAEQQRAARARRPRTHRRRPARPRDPTPVRRPACPCRRSPARWARARPPTASLATVADLDAHHRPDPHRHLRTPAGPPDAVPAGLRGRLLDVVADVTPALGFDPAVRFSGPLDTLPDDLGEDLLAVLREALTNVARHAHARTAEVDLTAAPERAHARRPRRRRRHRRQHPTQRPGQPPPPRRTPRRRPSRSTPGPTGTRLTWSVPPGLSARHGTMVPRGALRSPSVRRAPVRVGPRPQPEEDRCISRVPAGRPRDRAARHRPAARDRGRHRGRGRGGHRRPGAGPRSRPCGPTSPSSTCGCPTATGYRCAATSGRGDPAARPA